MNDTPKTFILVTAHAIPLSIAIMAQDQPAITILTIPAMLLLLYLVRNTLVIIILLIAITVGVFYGLGEGNALAGALIADLLLATGWIWALNTRRKQ